MQLRPVLCALVLATFAAMASAQQLFTIVLNGSQEVPPNNSPATGVGVAFLNTTTDDLTLNFSFSGLLGVQTAAHLRQGAPGVNGPVMIGLPSGSPVNMTTTITPAIIVAMLAGNTYVNISSTFFGGGEIRGQIVPVPSTPFSLTGLQEVPPTPSAATGQAHYSYDAVNNRLFVAVTLMGLMSQTAAHIHEGAPGVNGPVRVTLPNGSFAGVFTLSDPVEAAFLAGNTYVNCHTTAFPGGEIRGQIAQPGACCLPGFECAVRMQSDCLTSNGTWGGANTSCGAPGFCVPPRPCTCDWNMSGRVNSQDFFDFVAAFFSGAADFNNDQTTNSQDFFDFLACFFDPPTGC